MISLGLSLQIGEIITSAKIVGPQDLVNAAQMASRTGLPTERVLVMLELVTEDTIQAAKRAQALVRDHVINAETAAKALSVVANYKVDLDRALEHIGSSKKETNRLGDLLVSSGLLSKEQLTDALKTSQHLNLPLGRILVLKNVLSEQVVESGLESLILLRDGVIDRKQALIALKAMDNRNFSFENCLYGLGVELNTSEVRIGELIVQAELVNKADLLTALEISLMEQKEIGQSLIEFGFINEKNLESALELQKMVNNASLSVEEAVKVLKKVVQDGSDVVLAVSEVSQLNVDRLQAVALAELLHRSGLVSQEETEKAVAISYASKMHFNEILLKYSLIEEDELQIAIRCHLLIAEGNLSIEQAIFTLHQCHWTGASLAYVLGQMGWMQNAQTMSIVAANNQSMRQAA